MANGLAYNMYEPALVVLQPKEKVRKYFPCRNIVVEGKERKENPCNKYFPVGWIPTQVYQHLENEEWTVLRNRREPTNARRSTAYGSKSSAGQRKRLER